MKVNVLICTVGSSVSNNYVGALTATLIELSKRKITYRWLNGHGSLQHNNREICCTGNGLNLSPMDREPLSDNVEYDKLIWIDPTMYWTPEDFFKLLRSDKDVVTGLYLESDNVTTNVTMLDGTILTRHELLVDEQIKSTKLGFIAIKAGVHARVGRPWYNVLPGFRDEEDTFCHKLTQAGIDIYMDPSVKVNKSREEVLTW
jgi:hypothetical protein